jgi:aubergine-like protein
MVVGIDVYHDNSLKGGSIAGVVTALNDTATRYYSAAVEQKQGQEIMDALRIAFIEGLIKYWEANRKWPASIVVFRDGVGDGQLETTEKHEAEQFMRVFSNIQSSGDMTEASRMAQAKLTDLLPSNYAPGFSFIVVQKRINTRILGIVRKGTNVRSNVIF